jgi:hypothetical protein
MQRIEYLLAKYVLLARSLPLSVSLAPRLVSVEGGVKPFRRVQHKAITSLTATLASTVLLTLRALTSKNRHHE